MIRPDRPVRPGAFATLRRPTEATHVRRELHLEPHPKASRRSAPSRWRLPRSSPAVATTAGDEDPAELLRRALTQDTEYESGVDQRRRSTARSRASTSGSVNAEHQRPVLLRRRGRASRDRPQRDRRRDGARASRSCPAARSRSTSPAASALADDSLFVTYQDTTYEASQRAATRRSARCSRARRAPARPPRIRRAPTRSIDVAEPTWRTRAPRTSTASPRPTSPATSTSRRSPSRRRLERRDGSVRPGPARGPRRSTVRRLRRRGGRHASAASTSASTPTRRRGALRERASSGVDFTLLGRDLRRRTPSRRSRRRPTRSRSTSCWSSSAPARPTCAPAPGGLQGLAVPGAPGGAIPGLEGAAGSPERDASAPASSRPRRPASRTAFARRREPRLRGPGSARAGASVLSLPNSLPRPWAAFSSQRRAGRTC